MKTLLVSRPAASPQLRQAQDATLSGGVQTSKHKVTLLSYLQGSDTSLELIN